MLLLPTVPLRRRRMWRVQGTRLLWLRRLCRRPRLAALLPPLQPPLHRAWQLPARHLTLQRGRLQLKHRLWSRQLLAKLLQQQQRRRQQQLQRPRRSSQLTLVQRLAACRRLGRQRLLRLRVLLLLQWLTSRLRRWTLPLPSAAQRERVRLLLLLQPRRSQTLRLLLQPLHSQRVRLPLL